MTVFKSLLALVFLISFLTVVTNANHQCSNSSIFCLGLKRQNNDNILEKSENCFIDGDCELFLNLEYDLNDGSFIRFKVNEKQPPSPSDLNFAFSTQKRDNLSNIILFGYKKQDRNPQTFIIIQENNDPPGIETLTTQNELKDNRYHGMYADKNLNSEKGFDSQRIRSASNHNSLIPFRTLPGVTSIYYTSPNGKTLSKVDFMDNASTLWLLIHSRDQLSWIDIKPENRRAIKSQASYRSSSSIFFTRTFSQFLTTLTVILFVFSIRKIN